MILAGLWFASGYLSTGAWVRQLIVTLAVLVWLAAILRVSGIALRGMSHSKSSFTIVEERTLPLFDNLAKVLLVGLAAYFLIGVWELDAMGFLASAGVAGIALGFAAQDTLANLFAGGLHHRGLPLPRR